jgi:hypothetical protein
MPRLELISFDDGFCRSYLEQFKQYASVPDDSRDALLDSLLKTAVMKVQESANVAIAACTYRVTAAVPASGIVRLYMGGGDITECVDADGDFVRFDPLPGARVQTFLRTGYVKVTYQTVPVEGERERLLPTVFRYGTALYDGEDPKVLNMILMEVL